MRLIGPDIDSWQEPATAKLTNIQWGGLLEELYPTEAVHAYWLITGQPLVLCVKEVELKDIRETQGAVEVEIEWSFCHPKSLWVKNNGYLPWRNELSRALEFHSIFKCFILCKALLRFCLPYLPLYPYGKIKQLNKWFKKPKHNSVSCNLKEHKQHVSLEGRVRWKCWCPCKK